MYNYRPLHYDDFVQIVFTGKFEKKISQTDNERKEDYMNVFMIQFLHQYPEIDPEVYKTENKVYLEGLSLMLITHDSHDVHE